MIKKYKRISYKYGKHSKYNKYMIVPMKNHKKHIKCTNMQTGTSMIISIADLKDIVKHNKNMLIFGKAGINNLAIVQEYIKESE